MMDEDKGRKPEGLELELYRYYNRCEFERRQKDLVEQLTGWIYADLVMFP